MALVKPFLSLVICCQTMTPLCKLPHPDEAGMTIEMIAVVETTFESGETFHDQLHGRRGIGCKDDIEVIWIGVEKLQDFRSSIRNDYAGRAWVGCIGVRVCQECFLHLGRKALELRLAGQSSSTMVKVR
jgi:hypothetical protein